MMLQIQQNTLHLPNMVHPDSTQRILRPQESRHSLPVRLEDNDSMPDIVTDSESSSPETSPVPVRITLDLTTFLRRMNLYQESVWDDDSTVLTDLSIASSYLQDDELVVQVADKILPQHSGDPTTDEEEEEGELTETRSLPISLS